MKKWIVVLIAGLFLTGLIGFASAAGNADEAKTLVEKGIQFYKANGKDKALAEFSNPKGQFVKGELYIFIWDVNGTVLAHGTNQKLIGKDVSGLKDADGKLFVKDGLELAKSKGSGWVDYKWTNPVTKKMDDKTTFVKKVDDLIFCCGIYK
ncbi:MAG: cache domain-containing protein [Deltaproteobacteria bacterium]|nr:cache domain-containing protein [Deltaproteobacteria bacterium]